jgi:hypothetical protein
MSAAVGPVPCSVDLGIGIATCASPNDKSRQALWLWLAVFWRFCGFSDMELINEAGQIEVLVGYKHSW